MVTGSVIAGHVCIVISFFMVDTAPVTAVLAQATRWETEASRSDPDIAGLSTIGNAIQDIWGLVRLCKPLKAQNLTE